VPVDTTGRSGPTKRQTRSGDWRRTSRGLYVPSYVETTTEQRIVEAAAVLPAYGGVTGWAALRWLGGTWFEGTRSGGRELRQVTLAVADRSIRPQPGIVTSEERLSPTELQVWLGLRVTSAIRSLFFEMRYAATETEAVQCADMAAYDDLATRQELLAFAAANPGWTGIDRFRIGSADMSENAWSPTEVTMRRFWEREGGLPRPLCNRPVFDLNGHHIGTPDLIDPVNGVLGEYNGALHLEGSRRSRDVQRDARFRSVGLETVEMLAPDLTNPYPFLSRLREAYARAARIPAAERRWTLELPPWWIPTFTVAQRRGLDETQRARILGYRLRVS
jgi:hypothetical protein